MAYPKDSRGIHEECLAYELLSGPMGHRFSLRCLCPTTRVIMVTIRFIDG